MTLANGDLTTPARVAVWLPNLVTASNAIVQQLITSSSALVRNMLNRGSSLQARSITRSFDGNGNRTLVLPDYPLLSVTSLQLWNAAILASPLPAIGGVSVAATGYGYRVQNWDGNLPGDPAVLEFVNGVFVFGTQNVQITYKAGYGVLAEPAVVPTSPYQVTVAQVNGICCADNGVTYANGTPLVAVKIAPTVGQYIPPVDTAPGVYTFSSFDAGANVLISYSIVPSDLEEAVIQMVAERFMYRQRIGIISQGLGGQEQATFSRGIPKEVQMIIQPYVSVLPPDLGVLL